MLEFLFVWMAINFQRRHLARASPLDCPPDPDYSPKLRIRITAGLLRLSCVPPGAAILIRCF